MCAGPTPAHVRVEIEPAAIDALLREVHGPELRAFMLKGMLEIVSAEKPIDHRERRLLRRALAAWGKEAPTLPAAA